VTVSLVPPEVEVFVVVEVEERVGVEEGAWALRAARMWAGVTVLFELEEARSMAPLRTSNSDLTSPVCDAIFFVRSINVGNGKKLFPSPSSSKIGRSRARKMSSS
jgi:hypothetical protein